MWGDFELSIGNVVCIKRVVCANAAFETSDFSPPGCRTMDRFTRRALFTADSLFHGDFSKIDGKRTGIALQTCAGSAASLKEIYNCVHLYGYKGINPSFFPNVMLSTALSHLAIFLQVHGPACTFYSPDQSGRDALEYCKLQLHLKRCTAMILICADESGPLTGAYFIRKDLGNENRSD